MTEATLKEQVTRGVAWNGGATVITRVFQAVVTIILARLLAPRDFGVVGMTTLYTGFVAMFTELGLVSAIIQADDVGEAQLNTVFWFASGAGIVAWALSVASAPLLAEFFKMPVLAQIVPVSAAGMAIGSLGLVHRALLSRRLDFRSVALADVVAAVAFGATAITCALSGLGPWSLVWGGLAMIGARTAMVWRQAAWLPGTHVTRNGLGALLSFGTKTLGVSLTNYMRSNVDYLVIGRFIGAAPLGQYTLAFKIADFPRARVTPIFTAVAFPAFSAVKGAVVTIRNGYLRGVRLVSLVVFPVLVGAALVAQELIVTVYGAKWLPSVFPARVLLLMGLMLTISEVASAILLSKGRPGLQLAMSSGYTVAVAALVFAALGFGINGVAIAVSVATGGYFLVLTRVANRAIGVTLPSYLRALQPTLTGCALMTAVILAARQLVVIALNASDVAWLATAVLVGALAYATGIGATGREEIRDVLGTMFAPAWRRVRARLHAIPEPRHMSDVPTGEG